jgi:hypothetical protein
MTTQEFDDLLTRHDWYYHFSDDNRVYTSGVASENKIKFILRNCSDDFKRIYNEHHARHYRREIFHPNLDDYKPPFPDVQS